MTQRQADTQLLLLNYDLFLLARLFNCKFLLFLEPFQEFAQISFACFIPIFENYAYEP